MIPAIEEIAEMLEVNPEQLWRESLSAYIAREKRLAQLDILDIQERYDVKTPEELVQQIESGAIYSHPAWEDLIEWENLLAHIGRFDKLKDLVT